MLEGGRIRYEGTAKELTEQPELLRSAYLLRGKAAAPALDAALDRDRSDPSPRVAVRLSRDEHRAAGDLALAQLREHVVDRRPAGATRS